MISRSQVQYPLDPESIGALKEPVKQIVKELKNEQVITSSSTITPNLNENDNPNLVIIKALAVALTIANPIGAPINGQKFIIRIKDDGTARGISFGTQYRAMGTALPNTTVLSKTLYLGFIWNSIDSKMDLVASAQEA